MGTSVTDVGHRLNLTKRFAKALASMAIVGTLALGAWAYAQSPTVAGGETRTISLVHIHTKETVTVTYMQNGRYVPSAMKKVNYLMRDWRRNEVITIDPKTLDLMWELHADLGSQRPIYVVCGYRSPRTNAFLKRIGRKVAKASQHMKGKAIDFYFPDVPTQKIRNSALVRRIGGVGYYRSSGGPTGFLHIDSGNVRQWGPAISKSQMASIMREGSKTVGKRLTRKGYDAAPVAVADENAEEEKSGGLIGLIAGKLGGGKNTQAEKNAAAGPTATPLESAYTSDYDELAEMSADAAAAGETSPTIYDAEPPASDELAAMAQTAAVEGLANDPAYGVKKGFPISLPRLKPQEIMQLAALSAASSEFVSIEPASAPPELQTRGSKPSPIADSLGPVEAAETLSEGSAFEQTSNTDGKTSFAAELRNGTADEAPLFEPTMAALNTGDAGWWSKLFVSADELLRRNGTPPELDSSMPDVLPRAAILGPDGSNALADVQHAAEGKGDALYVMREGKGGLPPMPLRLSARTQDLSQIEQ